MSDEKKELVKIIPKQDVDVTITREIIKPPFSFPKDIDKLISECSSDEDRYNLCIKVFSSCEKVNVDNEIEWFFLDQTPLFKDEETIFIKATHKQKTKVFEITKREENFVDIVSILLDKNNVQLEFKIGIIKTDIKDKSIERLKKEFNYYLQSIFTFADNFGIDETTENYHDKITEITKELFSRIDIAKSSINVIKASCDIFKFKVN